MLRKLALTLLWPLLLMLWVGCSEPPPELATARVEKRAFVHQVRAEGRLKSAEQTSVAVPQDVERSVRLAWLAEEGTVVAEGDLVARFDRLAFEQMREDSGADLAAAVSKLTRVDLDANRDIGALKKDYDVADLELIHAQRFLKTDQEVFSRRDILEDAIDEQLAQDRKEHAEGATEVRLDMADKEKRMLGIERSRAEREKDRAEKGLEALEVRAPHPGILTLKRDWQGEPMRVGMEIWRGQEIATIPKLDAMEAEVWVLEADAGGLAEGLEAEMIVEAHPERTHSATVLRMDALAKPKRRGSPVQYFGVTLQLEETDPEVMKPGQRVRATLRLAERDDALVVPRQAVVRDDSGKSAVWVRDGGAFQLTRVGLGPVSPGLVVIEEGLDEGQVVALSEPPPSLRVRQPETHRPEDLDEPETDSAQSPDAEPAAESRQTAADPNSQTGDDGADDSVGTSEEGTAEDGTAENGTTEDDTSEDDPATAEASDASE